MKLLKALIIITALALVGIFLGAPFLIEREAEEIPETRLVSEPAPPLDFIPPVDNAPHVIEVAAVAAPLPRDLILREPVPMRTKFGQVVASPGTGVKLVADEGPSVRIQWQKQEVRVPRTAVAAGLPALSTATATAPLTPPQQILAFWNPSKQAPVTGRPTIALEAREAGTARKQSDDYHARPGVYLDRDIARRKILVAEARNVSSGGTGLLEMGMYWIASTLPEKIRYVHHQEIHPLEIGPVSFIRRQAECPPLDANQQTLYSGQKVHSGARMEGWVVTLSRDGRCLSAVASSDGLRTVVADDEKLVSLLASRKPSTRVTSASTR